MRSSFIPAAFAAVLMACTPGETERGRTSAGEAETGMSGDVGGRDTASSGTPTGERPASVGGVLSQIEAHRANVDAIRNQMLPAAGDPDVRAYLEQTLASMKQHLAELERIQGQLEA